MGYRSEVAVTLSKKAAVRLKAKLKATSSDERYLLDHADSHSIDESTGQELYRWNYVKWYPEYKEVSFIGSFLEELNDGDYLFLRIGENFGDVERSGEFFENIFGLDVSTSIVTA